MWGIKPIRSNGIDGTSRHEYMKRVEVEILDAIVQSRTYTWDAHNKQVHGIIMEYYWLNSDMLHLDRSLYPLCQLRLKRDSDQRRAFKQGLGAECRSYEQPKSLTPNRIIDLWNSVKKFFTGPKPKY